MDISDRRRREAPAVVWRSDALKNIFWDNQSHTISYRKIMQAGAFAPSHPLATRLLTSNLVWSESKSSAAEICRTSDQSQSPRHTHKKNDRDYIDAICYG